VKPHSEVGSRRICSFHI